MHASFAGLVRSVGKTRVGVDVEPSSSVVMVAAAAVPFCLAPLRRAARRSSVLVGETAKSIAARLARNSRRRHRRHCNGLFAFVGGCDVHTRKWINNRGALFPSNPKATTRFVNYSRNAVNGGPVPRALCLHNYI